MKLLIGIGIVFLLIFGHEAYRVYRAFAIARPIIDAAVPFTQKGDGARYLFVGESTGVGTGALRPEESVAGRLGSALLSAHIDNVSENGARITDAQAQLERLGENVSYDAIVLLIGGNDILNFTSSKKVTESIRTLMHSAKARAGYVYLMTTGDVGNAPAFGPILSSLYSARSKELREVFIEEAKRSGVIYVDLFMPKASDPFYLEPRKYHAADGVHPSSEGYGVWYGKLREAMK
jgi:lysophospholipase L1-like esterase